MAAAALFFDEPQVVNVAYSLIRRHDASTQQLREAKEVVRGVLLDTSCGQKGALVDCLRDLDMELKAARTRVSMRDAATRRAK